MSTTKWHEDVGRCGLQVLGKRFEDPRATFSAPGSLTAFITDLQRDQCAADPAVSKR